MTSTRAGKGGQHGKNGEWYEGGQFLPSSEKTIKGEFNRSKATRQAKSRKQQTAPYKWEISEKKAIWSLLDGRVKFVGETTYSKETGKIGQIELAGNWSVEVRQELEQLVSRWNNGERWM